MGAEGYWAFAVGYDADAEDDEDKVIQNFNSLVYI